MTNDACFSFAKALRRALDGLFYVIRTQANFRIQLMIGLLIFSLSFLFQISFFEFITIFITILLVLVAEMINTAFEAFTNLVNPQWREQAKIAKDVAAGMVFLVSIGAILIGLIVFIPHFEFLVFSF